MDNYDTRVAEIFGFDDETDFWLFKNMIKQAKGPFFVSSTVCEYNLNLWGLNYNLTFVLWCRRIAKGTFYENT